MDSSILIIFFLGEVVEGKIESCIVGAFTFSVDSLPSLVKVEFPRTLI